jgi:hypothetical protein
MVLADVAGPRNAKKAIMRKCENVKRQECENATNAKLRKCENAEKQKMRKCENPKMRECQNANNSKRQTPQNARMWKTRVSLLFVEQALILECKKTALANRGRHYTSRGL